MEPAVAAVGGGAMAIVGIVAAVISPLIVTTLSGWNRLANQRPATSRQPEKWINYQSMSLGVVRYGNCVSVAVADDGLYLRLAKMFFPMSKTIKISWQEIRSITSTSSFLSNRLAFTLTDGTSFTLRDHAAFRDYMTRQIAYHGLEKTVILPHQKLISG